MQLSFAVPDDLLQMMMIPLRSLTLWLYFSHTLVVIQEKKAMSNF